MRSPAKSITGIELSRQFYESVVRPRITAALGAVPHAVALLGDGSEVLGFDDAVSTDHDFGPRLQLFLPLECDPSPLAAVLNELPAQFKGFPVRYRDSDNHDGDVQHQVDITTAPEFFIAILGVDPSTGMSLGNWLSTPTQVLATLTGGEVFFDPTNLLGDRRSALRWYPPNVWRYVLASAWLRISQGESFVGRTGATGDDLGCALVTAQLVRDLVRLTFLIDQRWAPYTKWLGRAFTELPHSPGVAPALATALTASTWRERETALCNASSALGEATNLLGLAETVDSTPRQFHTRDIRVIGAERFTQALIEAITDRQLHKLVSTVGTRADGVYQLSGAIDQMNVDVLNRRSQWATIARGLW
ncbi:MAG: DUF4037 domain-containing protein [Mycobacteriales bacterium]